MQKTNPKARVKRNNSLVDTWSFVHLASSATLAVLLGPIPAIILVTVWEPIEIFILSPLMSKRFNILFGHEGLKNSLSDLVFNTVGVVLGTYVSL